jgi:hypothetical protein
MGCNVRDDFRKSSCTASEVQVMTHMLRCDVVRPAVLYLGRNGNEIEMHGLTVNTGFLENSSLSSNLNILSS